MKVHNFENITMEPFQRVGHLHITDVNNFLALLKHQIGPTDPQSFTDISSNLTELRWSRRGLVLVYTEVEKADKSTEMLFDCTDSTTWSQMIDVLALIGRLSDSY